MTHGINLYFSFSFTCNRYGIAIATTCCGRGGSGDVQRCFIHTLTLTLTVWWVWGVRTSRKIRIYGVDWMDRRLMFLMKSIWEIVVVDGDVDINTAGVRTLVIDNIILWWEQTSYKVLIISLITKYVDCRPTALNV